MLSDDNLATILDEELGFIVAHTLRRNAEAARVIEKLGGQFDRTREEEKIDGMLLLERTNPTSPPGEIIH